MSCGMLRDENAGTIGSTLLVDALFRSHCLGHSATRSTNVIFASSNVRADGIAVARRRQPLGHLPYPIRKRALQLPRAPIPQPALQRIHHPQQILGRAALLQAGDRAQQVAPRQIAGRHPLHVKQAVALRAAVHGSVPL